MKTLEQIVSLLLGFEVTEAKPGDTISMQASELARFYAACRAEALEEAAIVAERLGDACAASHKYGLRDDEGELAYECAAAIREMK